MKTPTLSIQADQIPALLEARASSARKLCLATRTNNHRAERRWGGIVARIDNALAGFGEPMAMTITRSKE